MKKRVLSLFLTCVMLLGVVPIATVTVSASTAYYDLQLAARYNTPGSSWETNEDPFVSSSFARVTAAGGSYTLTIDEAELSKYTAGGEDDLVSLAIMTKGANFCDCKPGCDGGFNGLWDQGLIDFVPGDLENGIVIVESIKINDKEFNYLSEQPAIRNLKFNGYVDFNDFTMVQLWNGWSILTDCILVQNSEDPVNGVIPGGRGNPRTDPAQPWDEGVEFRLPGNEKIKKIEVSFSVIIQDEPSPMLPPEKGGATVMLAARDGENISDSVDWRSEPVALVNGTNTVTFETGANAPEKIASLAIMTNNGNFHPTAGFVVSANPVPRYFNSNISMKVTDVLINDEPIGVKSALSENSPLVNTDPGSDGYVYTQLWNAWAAENQNLTTGITTLPTGGEGTVGQALAVGAGETINTVTVEFEVSGLPEVRCMAHDDKIAGECDECAVDTCIYGCGLSVAACEAGTDNTACTRDGCYNVIATNAFSYKTIETCDCLCDDCTGQVKCKNCGGCRGCRNEVAADRKVPSASYNCPENCSCSLDSCKCHILGDINGDGEITIADALQTLMWVARMPTSLLSTANTTPERARASHVTDASRENPSAFGIGDALQVLMGVARMPTSNVFSNTIDGPWDNTENR